MKTRSTDINSFILLNYNIIYKQMSTNRSPLASRYTRKENYQSLNYPSTLQNASPHRPIYPTNHEHSANKKSIQQKQIEDLELKVDLILEHNDKLVNENTELKKKLAEAEIIGNEYLHKERLSRYQVAEQTEYAVRKLSSQLMIKNRELQHLIGEFQAFKEITRKEADSMRDIINGLTLTNQALKGENLKLAQEFSNFNKDKEAEIREATKGVERRANEEIEKIQKQKEQELARQKAFNNKLVEELTRKFEEERAEWQNRKNILINKLQDTHSKEINELREQMENEFHQSIRRVQEQADERCKIERDKADKFIKEYMDTFEPSNEAEAESLRQEIKLLQESLQNRKKFIEELSSQQFHLEDSKNNLSQTLALRQRLKEQIEHLMRENQMLKVKTAEKYQKDLKQAVKIYEDKIEVLSTEVRNLSDQNDRLRHNYEDEVTNRIRTRRNWEIEVGQLKNLIRKLKAELQGVQDQFRLNIDGIRDQNATFSMALMKSMVQDKEKANFFEQENRKLRTMYEKHQAEVQVEKKQANQKVKYYESKIEHLKALIREEKEALHKKEDMLAKKFAEREEGLRESIKKERQHMQQTMFEIQEQRQHLEKELIDQRQKCSECQMDLKEAQSDIDRLTSKIRQNGEYIQRLRMQLQMAGVDDHRNEAMQSWKGHYEGIILKLEDDKKDLKLMIDNQNKKIQQLTYKYRLLEEELAKASLSLAKRGQLDNKVIHLGLDENLIKNMGELWAQRIPSQAP